MDPEVFKALSDSNRLLILELLKDSEHSACELLEFLNITQPTLSHHMKVLQNAGLVDARRSGQWTYYSIVESKIDEVAQFILGLESSNNN